MSLSSSGQIASAAPKSDAISSVERIGASPSGGGSIGSGDLKALKAEKRMLKVKLRKFEEEYVKEHGHKPHSYQVQSINVLRTLAKRASSANVCSFCAAFADSQARSLAQEVGSIRTA